MEKYIYILVGILWFVSGIYKAYKKGQSKQLPGEKPERKKSVLETTLDDLLRESEKINNPARPIPATIPAKEYPYEKPVSQEVIYDESSHSSENQVEEARSLESIVAANMTGEEWKIEPEKTENTDLKNNAEFFKTDLKTLFVFSEIIGKPKSIYM